MYIFKRNIQRVIRFKKNYKGSSRLFFTVHEMVPLFADLKQPLPLQILIGLLVDYVSTGVLILLLKNRWKGRN